MYSWYQVAQRTEKVYDRLVAEQPRELANILLRLRSCGPYAGWLFCVIALGMFLLWKFWEWVFFLFVLIQGLSRRKYGDIKRNQIKTETIN